MKKIIIFLIVFFFLIVGCTKEVKVIEYINTTIVEYETKEVVIESEPIIQECPEDDNQDYINRLIRDYNRCYYELEALNNSDLRELVFDLNISLERCRGKNYDDCEYELDNMNDTNLDLQELVHDLNESLMGCEEEN